MYLLKGEEGDQGSLARGNRPLRYTVTKVHSQFSEVLVVETAKYPDKLLTILP